MATVYPHITTFPCLLCVLEPPWDPALVSQKQAESGGKLGENAFLYGHCSFLFLTFFFFFCCQEFKYVVLSVEFQNLFVKCHKKSGWKLDWDLYQL